MSKSKHFHNYEDADFEVIGSQPLSGLSDSKSRAIYDAIVKASNTLIPNSPGQTFTAGLTVAGIAPVSLQTYYIRNKAVIDGYFHKVNMQKLGDAIGPGVHDNVKSGLAGGFLFGLAAGFVIAKVLSR